MGEYDWAPVLEADEKVLWQGRPSTWFTPFLERADYLWWFVIAPCFLVLDWTLWQVNPSAQWLHAFLVAQIGFVSVMFFIRPWFDTMRRRRLRYAVTDQRALRIDARTGEILSSQRLEPGLTLQIDRHRTLRLGANSRVSAPVPMDWRVYPFTAYRAGPKRAFKSLSPNGYDEWGLEFRMIKDRKKVRALIEERLGEEASTTLAHSRSSIRMTPLVLR